MSRSSEERPQRRQRQKKSIIPRIILYLLMMAVMLGAGVYLGRTYLAGDSKAGMDAYYEKKYQEAEKMAGEDDYAGAIKKLQSIGDDWSSHDKADEKIAEYQEAFRKDLFEQLEVFEYQTQVQGVGNEDQIRILLDAAPYLAGDEEYEKRFLEVCLGAEEDSLPDEIPEDSTQEPAADDTENDVDSTQEPSDGEVYDFDSPETSND